MQQTWAAPSYQNSYNEAHSFADQSCAPAEYLNLHKGEWHAQLEQYHSSGAATAPAQVLVGELAIIQYKCLHVCLLKK